MVPSSEGASAGGGGGPSAPARWVGYVPSVLSSRRVATTTKAPKPKARGAARSKSKPTGQAGVHADPADAGGHVAGAKRGRGGEGGGGVGGDGDWVAAADKAGARAARRQRTAARLAEQRRRAAEGTAEEAEGLCGSSADEGPERRDRESDDVRVDRVVSSLEVEEEKLAAASRQGAVVDLVDDDDDGKSDGDSQATHQPSSEGVAMPAEGTLPLAPDPEPASAAPPMPKKRRNPLAGLLGLPDDSPPAPATAPCDEPAPVLAHVDSPSRGAASGPPAAVASGRACASPAPPHEAGGGTGSAVAAYVPFAAAPSPAGGKKDSLKAQLLALGFM